MEALGTSIDSLTGQETCASLQTLTSSSSFPGPGCSLMHHHSQDSPLTLASTPLQRLQLPLALLSSVPADSGLGPSEHEAGAFPPAPGRMLGRVPADRAHQGLPDQP